MSYILDALRRADAERERGAVPGLHAQNLSRDTEPAARDFRPLVWAAGGAGALAVAVVALLVFAPWRGEPAPAVVAAAPAAAPPAAVAAPAPAPAPVEPPVAPARVAPARVVPIPVATPPTVAARVASQAAAGRVAVLTSKAEAATVDPQAPVEHYGAPLPAPTRADPDAIVPIAELPPATRATLPKLSVGGAIYSDSASARMLILNGQIYHEGDKPAADTVLEQIRHKSAVLNFRGQRYEITF